MEILRLRPLVTLLNFWMVHAKNLKFHMCIPHEKKVDPYFSCPSYAPFMKYVSLKTKIKQTCVQYISKSICARAFIFDKLTGAEKLMS